MWKADGLCSAPRSATGQDMNTSDGTNPDFVDAASDWHLQPQSPARTAGRAVFGIGGSNGAAVPAGMYITGAEVIGLGGRACSAGHGAPATPYGLRVL